MTSKKSHPDPILDLYSDIQGICQAASSREYRSRKQTTFEITVDKKINQLKESDHGETFGDHMQRLWSTIPVEAQAESSSSLCDIIDNILNMSKGTAPMKRLSKGFTPVRVYRQSSSRKDYSSEGSAVNGVPLRQVSTRLNFNGDSPMTSKEEEEDHLQKIETLRNKLDIATKAKKEVEIELGIAKEYVKVANMNLEASNSQRDSLRESLASAENTIETLETKLAEAEQSSGSAPTLQKQLAESESYGKYQGERLKDLRVRLDEEEGKSEQLAQSLAQSQARENVLMQQLREANASRDTAAAVSRGFSSMSQQNSMRRLDDDDSGVLELPKRRFSVKDISPPDKTVASLTSTEDEAANYALAKDMWKKRDSISKMPVLPQAYIRERSRKKLEDEREERDSSSSNNHSVSPVSSGLPEPVTQPAAAAKDFWKQRDSIGSAPTPLGRGNSLRLTKGSDGNLSSKRLSVGGTFSIPVNEDVIKDGNGQDVFETPEGMVPVQEIVRRTSISLPCPGSPRRIHSSGRKSPMVTPDDVKSGRSDTDMKLTPLSIVNHGSGTPMASVFSPGDYDDDLSGEKVFHDDEPICLIEIGEFEARIGLWNIRKRVFESKYSCPAAVAVPLKGHGKPHDIVKGANIGSDPMFQQFRETGFFVGKDAWTCCFDHPDPGLRAALELQTLLRFGRIRNIEGMMMLMSHLLEKALPRDTRWTEVQILFNYNIACDRNDLSKLTRQIFQIMSPSKICFLDEAGLIARGTGFASAMIVDIGTTSTKVQPVFEDLTMRAASRVSKVGGEHCTNYLETLLHAQRNEKFSSQLERRRRQFARKLKEEHAFVCDSFEQSVADFGEFSFEAVNVMSAMNNQNRPRIACAKLNRNTQITSKIQLKEVITLSDNTPLVFTVDIERFYCAEVLFTPDLYEECKGELSIANLILQSAELISDEDVRKEVCACIAVTGKTAYIPGLKDRLRAELKDGMARLGVSSFDVVIAEDAKQPPSYPSASWRGADVVVKRATDMYNVARIEPQHFVTYEDWEVQGQNLEPYLF